MNFNKSAKYSESLLLENMMGPNSMKLLEESMKGLALEPGAAVLDLGCGKGLTSVFLAKEYGVKVYATDLWITATENYERFQSLGLSDSIVPIHAEAHDLPYANGFFDAIISVDSYHYYGTDENFMDAHLAPLLKSGGLLVLCIPGVKQEITDYPREFGTIWPEEELRATFHSCAWWQELLKKSQSITELSVREMPNVCFDECWNDWFQCDNEYARGDRQTFAAGAGKYLNFSCVTARKK